MRFHPDKNRGETAELAHAAFQEVVAALEVLGTPDKRAAFDELAGAGGQFTDFDARWENAEFAWDSDMYKGAKDITTLTERIWERRLVGESVWLVKCYAAWCPACKAHMGQFFATAEKLRDEVEVEVGAINCERPENKRICTDRLAVDAYPTLLLINRKHGTLARWPSNTEKAPDAVAAWALQTAHEWRSLFLTSDLVALDATSFAARVLADEERAWVVLFTDGLGTCGAMIVHRVKLYL